MKLKLTLSLSTLFFTGILFSQNMSIKGKVSDEKTGEVLPGAIVMIEGTTIGANTDFDGNYSINNLNAGTYTIVCKYISYADKKTTGVKIVTGQNTELNIGLSAALNELGGVEIVANRVTNTVGSMINEEKNSNQVVDGISGDQARTSQDRDVGQVIQRVPGVTIINNRFALIRGLSERYNTVMINDAISPSTEADRRSFSFDLIPTNLLDRMLIFKSGSAEIPGDFAGGVIKIYTRSIPDKNSFNIGIVSGYRNTTTFQPFLYSNKSSTDFLGFDDGGRSLPSNFPKSLNDFTSSQLAEISKMLPNTFGSKEKKALPDLRLNADVSRKFKIKDKDAGFVAAINYSNANQTLKIERDRYLEFEESDGKSPKQSEFIDDQYNNNVRLGLLNNWVLRFNTNHSIELKNMFNQLGENETTIRNGISLYQRPEDSLRNYSFRYSSRSFYSGQLCGNHEFNNDKTTLHWVTGLSYINRLIPDMRRVRTYKKIGSNDPYKIIIPPTATTFDASRFFSELKENTVMNSIDFEHKFFEPEKDSGIVVKAGYYAERKSRSFQARWTSYKSINNQAADSLSSLPIEQAFDTGNMNSKKGFFLTEGTNPSDKYDAQNILAAAYSSILIPYKKFKFITGARVEYNLQSLQSATQTEKVNVNNPITSLLPFVNIGYNVTPKMIVRAAYSKTVNRPEFREIAPFLYYDFDFNFDVVGNPKLKTGTIHNVDIRWEMYPNLGGSFSIGAFYKKFINPIESYIRQGADNPIFTYNNAVMAENYGIEAELRKSLSDMSDIKFIKDLSIVFNGALIKSIVDLGAAVTSQEAKRALQGQSPYIINTGIYYNNEDKGWTVNVLYNVFGKRIFIVGDRVNPTVYEMPRHAVDLTVNKQITDKIEFRFGVQDLLNYRTLLLQDSNQDTKITKVDEPILKLRRGTYFTAGFNFRF